MSISMDNLNDIVLISKPKKNIENKCIHAIIKERQYKKAIIKTDDIFF